MKVKTVENDILFQLRALLAEKLHPNRVKINVPVTLSDEEKLRSSDIIYFVPLTSL